MEPPRRSWLPVASNCPVSLRPLLHTRTQTHTASRSLSPHCALSPSKYPTPPPRSVGCGCRSLQGGSLLLIIDAKVIRSPRCVSSSIRVLKISYGLENKCRAPSISSQECLGVLFPFSKLFQTGAALYHRRILSSIGENARLLSKNCTNSSRGHRPRLSRNA